MFDEPTAALDETSERWELGKIVLLVAHDSRSQGYFYAMEFVEGETLESLIARSGPLEVKLALEIAMQVAAGLAAVHKQNLVHRDIKPSNIMVGLEGEGIRTVKIIDLGLAKTVGDSASESPISVSGDLPAHRNSPVRNNSGEWGSISVRIYTPLG